MLSPNTRVGLFYDITPFLKLGIYITRGDLGQAEEMYSKALEINEALGSKQGMAGQYSGLGIIYSMRGDLDQAEEMHTKALAINEALGSKEGIARDNGNLGLIYKTRGDLNQARSYWEESQLLYKQMGMKLEIHMVQGWLDEL